MSQKRIRIFNLFLVLAILGMLFPRISMGLVFKGVNFPDEVVANGETCKLMGVSAFKVFFFFTIEYCGYYMSKPTQNSQDVIKSEQTKLLVAHFCRDVKAKQLRNWYEKQFSKVVDYESNPGLREKVDEYLAFFKEDFKKNDKISFTYVPG
jgi:hypothetical protein